MQKCFQTVLLIFDSRTRATRERKVIRKWLLLYVYTSRTSSSSSSSCSRSCVCVWQRQHYTIYLAVLHLLCAFLVSVLTSHRRMWWLYHVDCVIRVPTVWKLTGLFRCVAHELTEQVFPIVHILYLCRFCRYTYLLRLPLLWHCLYGTVRCTCLHRHTRSTSDAFFFFAFVCCVHAVQCSSLAVYSILFYHYHYYYLGCRCWCRWCCWLSQLLLNILFSLENVDKQVSVASFLTHHLMWVCTPVHPVCVCTILTE